MNNLRFFLVLTIFVCACGPVRAPIPVGEIPKEATVSAKDEQYGHEVLNELTKQFPLSRNDGQINRVRDIVDRLTEAAHATRDPWHVYVLDDDKMKNAAATRGNYVFVWSGMLKNLRNDEELSTILAHEIGHVLAGHTMANPAEEVNKMITGVAGVATRQILSRQGGAVGVSAGLAEMVITESLKAFLINPEAQRKEFEADQIGLFIMADAGINPETAVNFWDRVRNDPDFGGKTLDFLSSHPSSEKRMLALRSILPKATARYRREAFIAPGRNGSTLTPREVAATRSRPDRFSGIERPTVPYAMFRVRDRGAQIFEEPDRYSRLLEELPFDTDVKVQCREGRWLKVDAPVRGFMEYDSLTPQDVRP